MKKRLGAMILAAAMTASLCACGQGSSSSTTAASTTQAETTTQAASSSQAESQSETSVAASETQASSGQAEYVMKVGYGTAQGHPIDLGAERMKELIEERSNGRIEVQLYPSAQLGSERQLVEGLMAGTIECTPTTTGPMSNFDPAYGLFDLPYLFTDSESVYSFLDGETGTQLLNELDSLGLVGAAWWENGWREFANSKKDVVLPEDLKGLKTRTMENNIHIDFFTSLGATATPMGFGDIYMAAKSGTIDGDDNPVSIFTVNKFYEVFKHLTLDNYVYSPVVVLFSKQWFDKLPEDLQQICLDAAYEVRTYERQVGADMNEEYLQTCKDNGVTVTELNDEQLQAWQEAGRAIYSKYEDTIGKDLIDKAMNVES